MRDRSFFIFYFFSVRFLDDNEKGKELGQKKVGEGTEKCVQDTVGNGDKICWEKRLSQMQHGLYSL